MQKVSTTRPEQTQIHKPSEESFFQIALNFGTHNIIRAVWVPIWSKFQRKRDTLFQFGCEEPLPPKEWKKAEQGFWLVAFEEPLPKQKEKGVRGGLRILKADPPLLPGS